MINEDHTRQTEDNILLPSFHVCSWDPLLLVRLSVVDLITAVRWISHQCRLTPFPVVFFLVWLPSSLVLGDVAALFLLHDDEARDKSVISGPGPMLPLGRRQPTIHSPHSYQIEPKPPHSLPSFTLFEFGKAPASYPAPAPTTLLPMHHSQKDRASPS